MAHQLTQRKDGKVEFGFTGSRAAIWHGLGQEIPVDANLDEWKIQAGLDWEVFESPVHYQAGLDRKTFPEKKVLFRSDTAEPLAIVGENFEIVQPGEVIDFFKDLVEHNGMRLSTAGSLFGGKKFWALAEMGVEAEITAGDKVQRHLLLTTAVDGTMATTGKIVMTRTVCNNTLTVALSEKGAIVKTTHRKKFDPTQTKIDLGVVDAGWARMIDNLRKMANQTVSLSEAREFYQKQIFDPEKSVDDQTWGAVREVNRLIELCIRGSGSDMSRGTKWGLLCGATELYTHGTGRRDSSKQFFESYMGSLENKKMNFYNELVAA